VEGANIASFDPDEDEAAGVGVNPVSVSAIGVGEDDVVMPGDAARNARASDASLGTGSGSCFRRRVAGGSCKSPGASLGRLPKSVCCIIAEMN
jgi:hypothetical protein